mmetsp:Transcript_36526/g.44056  ORF Transcript_36526/g.44056 Transcript_36526/m.44056 type:complete len:548 (-) Transcript_36526:32-1675(-)
MTEKGAPVDFFNKQAILSGERVPLILSAVHYDVVKESNDTAMMGQYINDDSMIPETTWENYDSIPYAARWLNGKEEKYNAICWEDRSDFTPEKKQGEHPSSQVGWHPGNRSHQWQGRKLAMVVLHALSAAFEKWEEGMQGQVNSGCTLPETYWHVGPHYETIRKHLKTHVNTPTDGEDVRSKCEEMYPELKRICRVEMHGYGMWTPRSHQAYDFLSRIKPALNGYKPYVIDGGNIYNGFDLLPLNQAIPDGDVDVHAIAIATTNPPPDLDHNWIEDDEGDTANKENTTETSTQPPRRQILRKASELAFKEVAKMEQEINNNDNDQQNLQAEIANNNMHEDDNTRMLDEEGAIVPGRGWEVHGWKKMDGFCDGSAQSECNRMSEQGCLLAGANDNHLDIMGNSLSGWLVFSVPVVNEGIILARMEWWCGVKHSLTVDWTEVNDGKTTETTPKWNETRARRNLKPTKDQFIPTDLEMDIAVNNGEIKTMKRDEWIEYTKEPSKNCAVWPLLYDESGTTYQKGETVEVAIRFRSKLMPQQSYCISHIYYS